MLDHMILLHVWEYIYPCSHSYGSAAPPPTWGSEMMLKSSGGYVQIGASGV